MRHQKPNSTTYQQCILPAVGEAANTTAPPSGQLLRLSQIIGDGGLLPISRAKFYVLVKQGSLPQPIKLGSRISCWRVADILAFIESNAGGASNV